MKKLIAITALVTLFSASVFAAPVIKTTDDNLEKTVAITSNGNNMNIIIGLNDAMNIRPEIRITDQQGHNLSTERLTGKAGDYKAFNVSELENGDYTITISAGQQNFKKQVHIYDEDGIKNYFFMQ